MDEIKFMADHSTEIPQAYSQLFGRRVHSGGPIAAVSVRGLLGP